MVPGENRTRGFCATSSSTQRKKAAAPAQDAGMTLRPNREDSSRKRSARGRPWSAWTRTPAQGSARPHQGIGWGGGCTLQPHGVCFQVLDQPGEGPSLDLRLKDRILGGPLAAPVGVSGWPAPASLAWGTPEKRKPRELSHTSFLAPGVPGPSASSSPPFVSLRCCTGDVRYV